MYEVIRWRKGNSAGNDQFMGENSTRGIIFFLDYQILDPDSER
jgi:hypothetical protein